MRALAIVTVGLSVVVLGAAAPRPGADGAPASVFRPCASHGAPLGVLDTSHVYEDREVDHPATASRSNPNVRWPTTADRSAAGTVESDARYGGDASVTARFVVDTLGCVDSSTFTVVTASDSAFTLAVRRVLPQLRYAPAKKGGRKVRSWVLWKFVFYRRNGAGLPY